MRESKLLQLVLRLDKTEIKGFDKFVKSPYFNTNETLITFWTYIKFHAPDFNFSKPTKKKAFLVLPIGKNKDEKKLNQLRFQLLKLLEEFLAIEGFKKSDFTYQKQIADIYLEKEIKEEFEKRYKKLLTNFGSEDFMTRKEILQKMSLYHELYFNPFHFKGDTYPDDLANCTRLLDQYYQQQQLFYASEWRTLSNLYSHEVPASIGELFTQIQDHKIANPKGIMTQLSLALLKMFLLDGKDAEVVALALKDQLTKYYTDIDVMEKYCFIKQLINFFISKEKDGKQWSLLIFELYELGLSDETIIPDGKMTNVTFTNIVFIACSLEKFDWAEAFIQRRQQNLFEEHKEEFIFLAKGYVAFFKKEYTTCLNILSNANTKHLVNLELIRKGMQIRSAFECYLEDENYLTPLTAHIESYNKYLQRKTALSEHKKNAYLNFNKLIAQIVNWKEHKKKLEELVKIKVKVRTSNPISEIGRIWLLEHISRFEKLGAA